MIANPAEHVLIVGVTTRALAWSAARAGYQVTAVDSFGDLDLQAVAQVIPAPRKLGTARAPLSYVMAATRVDADLVAYTSNLENYPRAVARLARNRKLLGNPPEVLSRVRNPIELARILRELGVPSPITRASAPRAGLRPRLWLLKPRRSGGGHGITRWSAGQRLRRSSYIQERIRGVAGSIVFLSDGNAAVPLGFSRQLIGDARLGARAFRYCGSILGTPVKPLFPRHHELLQQATALAGVVSREFGLVGLNGIDFIARDGVPYPVEVNPRYCASMELVERSRSVSLFQLHRRACQGELPAALGLGDLIHGKAVVFARQDVTLSDTRPWVGQGWVADIPHPGERISRGRPICTVFAVARTLETCERRLIRKAASVYRFAESRRTRAA